MDQKKKKPKKERLLFYKNNHVQYLNILKASKLPYKITLSNYTMDIESDCMNVYFMQSIMGVKAFIAGAKIKKDIIASKQPTPNIDKTELKYFEFSHEDILRRTAGEIYCVDIKSAYASALNNSGVISEETFTYISNVSKKDRLASLGMLASRKDAFYYENNTEVSHSKQVSEFENWFYFCVLEIQKVMEQVLKAIQSDFLFYWVDGIFFTGKHNLQIVENLIASLGYRYTSETCLNFQFIHDENLKVLQYEKENGKVKRLSLPKGNKKENIILLKHLKLIK
jgi:hypothetical protein